MVDCDDFKWGRYTLTARLTPGNSPGSMSFLCNIAGKLICFCGDVICPSQGPIISQPGFNPKGELRVFADRLWNFLNKLLLRDWDMDRNHVQSESASEPTAIGGIRKVSPHIYKVVQGNMYVLLSESGRALLIECACLRPDADRWLNEKLDAMERAFGLKTVDAIIPTHYHGDHLLDIPAIRRRYGAEVWAYENMAEILEFPEWSYAFRKGLEELSPYPEYEYLIDPYWAEFYP